jgi:hypothetical protein
MKCYFCVVEADLQKLTDDRDYPREAITTVNGTAVCTLHAGEITPTA